MRHRNLPETEAPRHVRLEISPNGSGGWRVTEPGVDVEGSGPTGPRAARDFCTKLIERSERERVNVEND